MTSPYTDKKPLTPNERQARHKARLARFGVKKIAFKASETQRELIRQGIELAGASSREEFILLAIMKFGAELGLSLKTINEELKQNDVES